MNLFKIILFHVINCILAMFIVMINMNFSTQVSTEIALYLIYSLAAGFAYLFFGYKFAGNIENRVKDIVEIWCISAFLVIISIIDIKTASILNLSFQPLAAVIDYRFESFDCVSLVVSLVPSLLMQAGYCFSVLKKREKN